MGARVLGGAVIRRLGHKPSPPGRLGLGAARLAAGEIRDTYLALPDPLDQLFQDCVANSGAVAIVRMMAVSLGNPEGPWPELPSRSALYALCRAENGDPLNVDDGTFIHSLWEAVALRGYLPESRWSYGPEHLEVMPDWEASRESDDQRLVKGAQRIVSTGDARVRDVALAITNGDVVQWGTVLDERFTELAAGDVWGGVEGSPIGGHAMLLHAVRSVAGRLQFASRSSWGRDFADRGSAWVDQDAIASANASDFWIGSTAPAYSQEAA